MWLDVWGRLNGVGSRHKKNLRWGKPSTRAGCKRGATSGHPVGGDGGQDLGGEFPPKQTGAQVNWGGVRFSNSRRRTPLSKDITWPNEDSSLLLTGRVLLLRALHEERGSRQGILTC